ncbi:MAG: hypothetical protein WC947_10330 [Elusimicrobiota bacterium]
MCRKLVMFTMLLMVIGLFGFRKQEFEASAEETQKQETYKNTVSNEEFGYFIMKENVRKEYEIFPNVDKPHDGRSIEEYYEISKNNFNETFIKVRQKSEAYGFRSETYLTYKLDPDTKEILLVENSADDKITSQCPGVILKLPLKVGKKWKYSFVPGAALRQIYETVGKEPPALLYYEREVTKKTTIKVPAGEFEVYVIKETTLINGLSRYEYWNKQVGLVASGGYVDKKWLWSNRLKLIK